MTPSELREAFRASRKSQTISVGDFGEVRLLSMAAKDAIPIMQLAAGFKDAIDPASMSEFWIQIVSKCIVDEFGVKVFDDDEGREIIRGLRIDWLTELGNAAISLNGMEKSEKKTD